jgi:DNA-binding IclR family transcriptional regulator
MESPQLVRADIRAGTRMPLSTSAAGLVLLAHASADRLSRLSDAGVTIPRTAVADDLAGEDRDALKGRSLEEGAL